MSPAQLLKLADGMIVKQKQRFQAAWTHEEAMLYVGVLQVSLIICQSCCKLSHAHEISPCHFVLVNMRRCAGAREAS